MPNNILPLQTNETIRLVLPLIYWVSPLSDYSQSYGRVEISLTDLLYYCVEGDE